MKYKGTNSRASHCKNKIRNRIHKHGASDVLITVDSIKRWFGVINRAAFGGKLDMPLIIFGRTRMTYGHLKSAKNDTGIHSIKISDRINTVQMYLNTLAHEMVHLWQFVVNGNNWRKVDHGKTFKQWKLYFKDNMGIII